MSISSNVNQCIDDLFDWLTLQFYLYEKNLFLMIAFLIVFGTNRLFSQLKIGYYKQKKSI